MLAQHICMPGREAVKRAAKSFYGPIWVRHFHLRNQTVPHVANISKGVGVRKLRDKFKLECVTATIARAAAIVEMDCWIHNFMGKTGG